jgi:carbohydrate diacid regulator
MLGTEAMVSARAAYGTIVPDLKDLSKSFKEAHMAMDVGRIFYPGRSILSYNELGIGRLIYQLPVNLCQMFLREIFGDYDPSSIDQETLATIKTFFDNNLNVSETARQLFIHRNTLVYRMEKLEKATGLDIRTFEDAMTFRIALMVSEYMKFLDRRR